MSFKRKPIMAILVLAAVAASGAAQAGGVQWSIGINLPGPAVVAYPAPVYGRPQVVYGPPPVYVPRVVYGPPVMAGPERCHPGRPHWRHGHGHYGHHRHDRDDGGYRGGYYGY